MTLQLVFVLKRYKNVYLIERMVPIKKKKKYATEKSQHLIKKVPFEIALNHHWKSNFIYWTLNSYEHQRLHASINSKERDTKMMNSWVALWTPAKTPESIKNISRLFLPHRFNIVSVGDEVWNFLPRKEINPKRHPCDATRCSKWHFKSRLEYLLGSRVVYAGSSDVGDRRSNSNSYYDPMKVKGRVMTFLS